MEQIRQFDWRRWFSLSVSRRSFYAAFNEQEEREDRGLDRELPGQQLDARYLGYFECFNRELFYEAHDVLEELWLPNRTGANGAFYKGLIQFAGAFVHLQKGRPQPAAALLRLARDNLQKYPAVHERLAVADVLKLIGNFLERLEQDSASLNPLTSDIAPKLALLDR